MYSSLSHVFKCILDTGFMESVNETYFQNWKMTTQRAFRMMSSAVILSLRAVRCSHSVDWRGHPLWLLSRWEPTCQPTDMTLFECCVCRDQSSSKHPDDKVTRSVKAAHRQEAGSSSGAPCLICQQLNHVWWCSRLPLWTAVLISARVTHLLPVTLRCARAERDRGECAARPSVRVYKQGEQTGQHGTHCVGGRGGHETQRAPVQPVTQVGTVQTVSALC